MLEKYTFLGALIDISGDNDLSEAVDINGYRVVGVAMPAAWTTADIAFQVDPGDGTFRKVYDNEATLVKIDAPAASGIYLLANMETANQSGVDPCITGAKVKVHSIDASDETDEAQAADRQLYLLCVAL